MKKIRNLPESQFLKLFFAFITLCFLIAAVCLPDRNQAFSGLWRIFSSTCRITTNYFAIGGFSATFLSMGLVGLVCLLLYCLRRECCLYSPYSVCRRIYHRSPRSVKRSMPAPEPVP